MLQMWQWPYEPEVDRYGIARVPVPERMRPHLERGYKVELITPGGDVLCGVVENFNSIAWIARVKLNRP